MKQTFTKTLLFILLPVLWGACSSDDNNDPTGGSGNEELKISIDAPNNEVSGKGASFFLKIETNGEWSVSAADTWCTFFKTNGTGTSSVICTAQPNTTGKQRSTTISVTVGKNLQKLTLTQNVGGDDPEPGKPDGYAGRIEIPQLKEGNLNLFYTHTSTYNGKEVITYSAEYDCTKKHTRWVAFTFDNVNNQKNTGRSDAWANDPKIPSAYQTSASDYSTPYNRGHLVASADRYVTAEANKQTFYYSNMSPQLVEFNGGIWAKMEDKVRTWADPLTAKDTLYIVKGGQIDGTVEDGTLLEYTGNHVAVPRHYFMAILSYKGGANPTYKAIAFYIDQKNYTSSSISSYVVSIDELEQKTGINFFHNLPDNTENVVEQSYNKGDWGL